MCNREWQFVSSIQCNLERASWQADGCHQLWPKTSLSLSACTCLALNLLKVVEQSVLGDMGWMKVVGFVHASGHSCQVGQCELERFHLFGSCEVASSYVEQSVFGSNCSLLSWYARNMWRMLGLLVFGGS